MAGGVVAPVDADAASAAAGRAPSGASAAARTIKALELGVGGAGAGVAAAGGAIAGAVVGDTDERDLVPHDNNAESPAEPVRAAQATKVCHGFMPTLAMVNLMAATLAGLEWLLGWSAGEER